MLIFYNCHLLISCCFAVVALSCMLNQALPAVGCCTTQQHHHDSVRCASHHKAAIVDVVIYVEKAYIT
jgi:hypothetical protein